jgi:hypothetical protein
MNRFFRPITIAFLAIGVAAGFGLVTSCNLTGGGGGAGNLTMLMTDAPSDEWTEVTVHFTSASLHREDGDKWEEIWKATADPASGKVNLIDLSGVSDILSAGTITAGTYDRLKLVMNTSTLPESMKLVTADGTQIASDNITVVDPSGIGEIKVELKPNLVVEADKNNILAIDFDLAHPLSIVNLDGKVVISLKVRHKALPRNLAKIQFARTLGDITAATANGDGTAVFTIENLQGASIDFKASGTTVYTDVTTGTPVSGTFDGLKALAGTGAALVASNMNADGSLFAHRVWYADSINKLPQFTPEGLVRRVGDGWFSIQGKKTETDATDDDHHRCDWDAQTVFVDEATFWNFQGAGMGDAIKGTAGLKYLARGFRVEVVYVDDNASPKVAQSVNIQFAHAEGLIVSPTLTDVQLGWWWHLRTFSYGSGFGWWFYGLDATRSTDPQGLIDAVAAARESRLWVFAFAGLTWDAANTKWVIEELVLAPLKLHDFTKITSGYNADANLPGSMVVSTYNCWDEQTPETMTVKLDAAGDLQTLVGSFSWVAATNVVTFTVPVAPSLWPTILVPTVNKVKIWVYPVKETDSSYSWHAYSVLVYQFIR